jgi:hypothetical protein
MSKLPKPPEADVLNQRVVDLQNRVDALEHKRGLTWEQIWLITGWIFIVCPVFWSLISLVLWLLFPTMWPFSAF